VTKGLPPIGLLMTEPMVGNSLLAWDQRTNDGNWVTVLPPQGGIYGKRCREAFIPLDVWTVTENPRYQSRAQLHAHLRPSPAAPVNAFCVQVQPCTDGKAQLDDSTNPINAYLSTRPCKRQVKKKNVERPVTISSREFTGKGQKANRLPARMTRLSVMRLYCPKPATKRYLSAGLAKALEPTGHCGKSTEQNECRI